MASRLKQSTTGGMPKLYFTYIIYSVFFLKAGNVWGYGGNESIRPLAVNLTALYVVLFFSNYTLTWFSWLRTRVDRNLYLLNLTSFKSFILFSSILVLGCSTQIW